MRKPKSVTAEHQRGLAVAARELLYGDAPYERRFDDYLGALAGFWGEPARWEIATALSALVHPKEHVCVHPAIFRQQLKASGSRSSIAARPSSAAYARLLTIARFVGTQLGEQGETPRDLLDVHDFIRIALKPAAKPRVAKATTGRMARPSHDEESAGNDDEESASNDDE